MPVWCDSLQGDSVRVIEPLHHLMACVRRVVRAPPGAGTNNTDAGNFRLLDTGKEGGVGRVLGCAQPSLMLAALAAFISGILRWPTRCCSVTG